MTSGKRSDKVEKELHSPTKDHGLSAVLYSISDGVITIGPDSCVQRMNLVAELLTGFTEKEAKGKHYEEVVSLIDENSRTKIELPATMVLEQGLTCELAHHTLLVSRIGNETPITCSLSPVTNESGVVSGLVLAFRDHSGERKLRNELIRSERNYREVFNSTNEAIFIEDVKSGKILDVNDAMLHMFGYENKNDVLKGNIGDLSANIGAYTEAVALSHIKKTISEGSQTFEWLAKKKNGDLIWIEVSLRKTEIGGKGRILAVARDISNRKKAEEELLMSRQTYLDLYNSVSEAIYIQDRNGTFIDVNKGAEKMYGYSRDELIGKTPEFVSAHGYNDLKEIARLSWSVFETGKSVQFEFYGQRKNGEIFPKNVIVNKGKFFEKDALITTARDISENRQSEISLKESQQLLRSILDTIPVRVFWKDKDSIYRGCNKPCAVDAGLNSPTEIIGKSDYDMGWKDQAELYRADDKHVIESGKAKVNYEEPQTSPDGKPIVLITSKIPLRNINNEIIGVLGAYEDITERKRIEEELRQSEFRFRSLIDNAPDGIVLLDKKLNFSYLSPSVERILGYTLNDGNVHPDSITHPEDLPEVHRVLSDLVQNPGKIATLKYRLIHKNGTWRWLESSITNLLHEPIFEALIINFRDITDQVNSEMERQKSAQALKESESRYRLLIETMNDGVMQVDNADKILFVNQRICEIFGYSQNELLGKVGNKTIIHPDDSQLIEVKNKLRRENITEHYEVRGIRKTGEVIWISISASPTFDLDGYVTGSVGIIRDVTESKKSEIALRESENKYRSLYESANDSILLMTEDHFVDCNTKTELMFRCSRNEIINKNVTEFSPPFQPDGRSSQEKSLEKVKAAIAGKPQFFEWQHKTFDGVLFDTEIALNKVTLDGKAMVQAIVRDITERKRAELITRVQYNIAHAMVTANSLEELFETVRTELSTLIDSTNFYIVFYNKETGMLESPFEKDQLDRISVWPMANSLTGMVIQQSKAMLLNKQEIRDLAESGEIVLRGSRAEAWLGVPLKIGNKTLGAIVVQSYNNPKAYDQLSVEVMELIANQLSIYIEKKHHEDDLIVAKERAEESDRLKTAFLNNMSHEIRTPMNGILGFTQLVSEPDILQEEREYYARIITQSSNQLLSIIEDIINIATIEAGQEKLREVHTDINHLFESLYIQFKNKVNNNLVNLNYRNYLSREKSVIVADETKLIQVITNLLNNALKFTREGKIEFLCKPDKDFLKFSVEDTGIGIAKEYHDLIFERFRQLDPDPGWAFEGNGLGLAISKAYVELMGGKIWVESSPGKGSTFYFTLPYKPLIETHKPGEKDETSDRINSGNITILLAEDEYSNYKLIEFMLKPQNINLIHVTNGKSAVEKCMSDINIDLVLMDLKMPVMDGFDATRIIKSERPDLPVIAITAYALAEDRDKALEAGCDDYQSKPLNRSKLNEIISRYQ